MQWNTRATAPRLQVNTKMRRMPGRLPGLGKLLKQQQSPGNHRWKNICMR